MKRVILCADDYGQNPAISQAIIELLKKKKLSATSCMTTKSEWVTQGPLLEPFKSQADIGLHFNLTEGKLLTDLPATPLNSLILNAHLKKLDKEAIKQELRAQLEQFSKIMNQAPAYIDGHQHVHQLPIVRDALFEVYESVQADKVYIRSTYNKDAFYHVLGVGFVKQLIIQLCGGFTFHQELVKRKIPHNTSFAGIYNFANAESYSTLFPRFLTQVEDNGIIMCHPGLMSSEAEVIAKARHYEYSYFSSQKFIQDCSEKNVSLTRFNYST